MIRRSNRCLFVPIYRVVPVEELDFLIDLLRREGVAPEMAELFPHSPWPEIVDFAEAAKDGKLPVSHAHVCFVRLYVGFCNGLEFYE
jgi:hypothetical protein